MTSAHALDGAAMSAIHSSPRKLSSIAPGWILANVLPQALLVAAAWAYLSIIGPGLAGLFARGSFAKLPHPAWFAIATTVVYVVASAWMRGAVLRPLVPRFSILGWSAAALLSGAVMLAATATGALVGLAVSKGLEVSGANPIPVPAGAAAVPYAFGVILGAEMIGLIAGGLPGLVLGSGEALAACRATRSKGSWIMWTAAAWSTIGTLIVLHAFLVVFHPSVSFGVLGAVAVAMPFVLGAAAALITLPAVARLARRQNGGD